MLLARKGVANVGRLLDDESLIVRALMMMMIACCLTPVNIGCAIDVFSSRLAR